ncbi:MAG TPA: response regulator transcription factor [Euzebyales bacterium]|nr:response regulator transcription factor [Euzebyales bacterium]
MTTRVVLADDQDLVRTGVRMILEAEDDVDVVGEARDGGEAVAACRRLRPDVVVMDIRMPRVDGVEATRQLTSLVPPLPTRVLVLTTYDLDEYVFAALRAGAAGFLLKHAPADELVAGIRTIARGESILGPAITRRVVEAFATIPDRPARRPVELETLTEREREVFELVARGRSNADIAAELYVEPSTVKTHVARALTKLGLPDRVAAVIFAYEHGVIVPGDGA